MKTYFHKNGKWIDIFPTFMIDWGNTDQLRIYLGWIYWTIELNFTAVTIYK